MRSATIGDAVPAPPAALCIRSVGRNRRGLLLWEFNVAGVGSRQKVTDNYGWSRSCLAAVWGFERDRWPSPGPVNRNVAWQVRTARADRSRMYRSVA